MVDITSRLRLVVDSTGLDRSGRKLRSLKRDAGQLKSAFASLAGVIGAAFSVQQLVKVTDQYRGIQNQLRLVTDSARELESVQRAVLMVANETGASLETTVRLYANLERFAGNFLSSQQETLNLTRAINQAAVISGASVTESSNAVRQLTQGIAGGILRAEEFNSIMENLPRLGEAIADGLGIGIGGLRQQVNDGLITSKTLIEALQSQFGSLDEEFLNTSKTIGQAATALGNILTVELGKRFQGVQQVAIDTLQLIGQNIDKIIPLFEGLAVAILGVGAAFAAPALVSGLAALFSPVGILATAIVTIVYFRDELAQSVLGVEDFGAISDNVLPVISERFATLKERVAAFAAQLRDAGNAFTSFFEPAIDDDALEQINGFISDVVNVVNRALEIVQNAVISVLRVISEAVLGAVSLVAEGVEKLAALLQDLPGFKDRAEGLQALTKEMREFVEAARLPEDGGIVADVIKFSPIKAILNESKKALNDIRAVREDVATAEEKVTKQTRNTRDEVKALTAEQKALAKIHQEIADQQEIVAAARLGEHQERIAREILNIRRQIKDISVEDASALAKQNVYLDEQLEIIREQRSIIEAPFDNLADNLEQAILNGGRAGVGGLKEIFKSFIGDLKDSFLRSLFQPLLHQIRNLASGIAVPLFGPGAGIGGGVASKTLGGIGGLISGVAGSVTGGFLGLSAGQGFSNLLGLQEGSLPRGLVTGGVGGAVGGALAGTLALTAAGAPLGTALGLGAVAGGPVGAIAGLVIGGLASLFGPKPSNRVGQVAFDPRTGRVVGTGLDKKGEQNLAIAQEIATQVSAVTEQVASLIGADVSRLLNVEVGRRSGITIGFQGRGGLIEQGQNFANTEAGALSAINAGISQAIGSLKGGDQELQSIAQALASAGVAGQELVDSLSQIAPLIAPIEEELTGFDRVLQEINKTFDEAIKSARGVAAAEDALNQARDRAIAAATARERSAFNDAVQGDIAQFLNGPLDQLERLLEAQQERLELAGRLGADIAEVERLTALELRQFFQGLNESALQEVQSFLGLFEEASNSVVRNLDLSRQDLQGQRDSFIGFAQQFEQLNTNFNERFIAASPRESLGILRGRATDLLGQVSQGNASAAQALPQVLNQLVENARQTFGNTQGFVDVLNFAKDISNQARDASLAVVSDAERQIAALDENNDILSDIRDILQTSQATAALFSSFNSGGVASSDQLLSLIQQGAGLTFAANNNAAALNVSGLVNQSLGPVVTPIANSIDTFTTTLSDLPNLMRLHIDATERGTDDIVGALDILNDSLQRIETLEKKQLDALDAA